MSEGAGPRGVRRHRAKDWVARIRAEDFAAYLSGSADALGRMLENPCRPCLKAWLSVHWPAYAADGDDHISEVELRLLRWYQRAATERLPATPTLFLALARRTLERVVNDRWRSPGPGREPGNPQLDDLVARDAWDVWQWVLAALVDCASCASAGVPQGLASCLPAVTRLLERLGRLPRTYEIAKELGVSQSTASRRRASLVDLLERLGRDRLGS
jgi:hypothetical protein